MVIFYDDKRRRVSLLAAILPVFGAHVKSGTLVRAMWLIAYFENQVRKLHPGKAER